MTYEVNLFRLSGLGLFEMSESEIQETNGGFVIAFLITAAAAVVGSAAYVVFNDWDNFKRGIEGRPEKKS